MASQDVIIQKVVGSSYQLSHARNVDDEISLNMYYEPLRKQNSNFSEGFLRSINGTKSVHDFGFSMRIGARGLYPATRSSVAGRGELYCVFGNSVYVMDADGNFSEVADGNYIGALRTPVSFAESGGVNPYLILANGTSSLYEVSELAPAGSKTLSLVTPPTNPYTSATACPTHIVTMGNRIICNDKGTAQLFVSRVGAFQNAGENVYPHYVYDEDGKITYESDGYTPVYAKGSDAEGWGWKDYTGAAQYETALSTTGDVVLTMKAINNNRLWVLGTRSFDVWELDSTDDGYTLSNTGLGTNIGCAAEFSVAMTNNIIAWLGAGADGANGVWMSTDGGVPEKISTPALDRALAEGGDNSDAIGFGYTHAGHIFYVLTLPTMDCTFVYDFTTGFWHNRSTHDDAQDADHAWWPMYATMFGNKVYFGTLADSKLVTIDYDAFKEYNGNHIKRMRRWAPLISDFSYFVINDLRIECGVGLTPVLQPLTANATSPVSYHETEGYRPKVLMRSSADGLKYNNYIAAELGRAGFYGSECRWNRLGMAKYFVCELVCTDPVDFYISDSKIRFVKTGRF